MNEKDMNAIVLIGVVNLILLLRVKRLVSIGSSTVNKHTYLYQKLADNRCVKACLHCTLEPVSTDSGTSSARPH